MKNIVMICKGGFSKELVEYLVEIYPPGHPQFRLKEVRDLHPQDELRVERDDVFVVAIGDPGVKRRLVERIRSAGGAFLSVIHPRAHVSPSARIGEGAILCPFAFVGPDAVLEPHVTLNIYAAVGHDARVGSYTVMSPYAFVAGNGAIAEGVFFGSQAFVAPGKAVGLNSKLAAGSICLRDVPENSLAMGNPAAARELFRAPPTPKE
jgi:sugar O-acyltransferase (sialic acid O-acetyltransferase NeuD family)